MQIKEGLKAGDLEDVVSKRFSVDQYASKMGDDRNIMVLAFTVDGLEPAKDLERFAETGLSGNAEMTPAEVREFCQAEESAQRLLKVAMNQLYLSARAFHRILKPARTIADLENADLIKAHHVAEAIQYRPRRML